MPTPPPDNAFDRLHRALTPADPTNDPFGLHKINIAGTVQILGGGAGGTSTTDDSSFVPGSSSLTPAGGYVGGRSVASGHVVAPALSASGITQVEVVAGGAGGGNAQNQIQGTANNWVGVGVASGPAGAAGNWALPVVYASGVYATVNIGNAHGVFGSVSMVGSVGVTPLATFTVALDKVATVNLGLGTVNIGNVPAVVGSVNVSAVGTFSVWIANAAAGGGFATVGIFGSASILGTVNIGGSIGAIGAGGSMGVVGAGGSMGVTQIAGPWSMVGSVNVTPVASYTVNIASHIDTAGSAVRVNVVAGGAGGGVANVQVRGTANTNVYVGFASGAPGTDGAYALPVVYASGFYPIDLVGSAVRVNVVAGGAGGGVANLQMRGTANTNVYLGVASGAPGTDGAYALPVVYASGLYPTVNLGAGVVGSVNATNLGGSVGALGIGGSMGVTQIGAPWSFVGSVNAVNLGGSVGVVGAGGSLGVTQIGAPWSVIGSMGVTPLASFTVNPGSVFTVNLGLGTVNIGNGLVGSVGVTPLASFTVNLGSIPTVNIGLGTVNIGNVVTATLPAVSVVDTRGSLTATQWAINFGGSGYSAISVASLNPAVRTNLYSVMIVATATVDISFQSPSGTFLTGSLRILPGAGFAMQTQLANPMLIGATNATLFIHATGTQNIGGWVNGWIGP